MSSLATFLLFPYLPKEIQLRIWQEGILGSRRSRLVLVDKETRQVVPTLFLSLSSLSVNTLSREVTKVLYPVQLPVFYICPGANQKKGTGLENEGEGVGDVEYEITHGASTGDLTNRRYPGGGSLTGGKLYLNFEHDTFYIEHGASNSSQCWTPPLTSEYCQLVNHLSK